jgi:prepilin-type N-terminal cleavage/methylation domain-containing protein
MNIQRKKHGFTLIEMLVVVLIIAIIVSIVVAVGGKVLRDAHANQTKINMKVILTAVQTYSECDPNNAYPPDDAILAKPGDYGGLGREWAAYSRSRNLYQRLLPNDPDPRVSKKLASLGKDGVGPNYGGNNVFIDGWGRPIEYWSNTGAGGSPLLVSAGGDGKWNDPAGTPSVSSDDDIRSDGR